MSLEFLSVLSYLPDRLASVLRRSDVNVTSSAQEIRLRIGRAVMLTCLGQTVYIDKMGGVCFSRPQNPLTVTVQDLAETFKNLCAGSVYAHTAEIRYGYVTMRSGHRAGVCGTYNENGTIKDITSINIRIAREVYGCATELAKRYTSGGLLIAGPPGSGKTTMLRDFVRIVSSGGFCAPLRVSVIDTRGEISGLAKNGSAFDLGDNTDITVGVPKALGIETAVRVLNPQMVAFDEIGDVTEALRTIEALNSGVYAVTTAHVREISELTARKQIKLLINSGAVSTVALLEAGRFGCFRIFDAKAVLNNAL